MRTNFVEIYKTDLSSSGSDLILNAFTTKNEKFKYFIDKPEIKKLYALCYEAIGKYFSQNNIGIPSDFNSYIYKAIFLFKGKDSCSLTTLENFDQFTKSFLNSNEALKSFLSIDSYSSLNFPNNRNYKKFDYDVDAMRTTLLQIGYPILKNIDNLSKIQKANQGKFPKNTEEFKQAALKAKFPLAEKNTQLAELVNYYDVDNNNFQEMLTLIDIATLHSIEAKGSKILVSKPTDNLPNVIVKYINPNTKSQYHLVKLPPNDFRALMLGDITGNCQTLGNNDADPFIIDGVTRPNNGFYIIIKQGKKFFNPASINWDSLEKDGHEIIGQSYAWIGRDDKTITWEAPQLVKDRAPNIDIKEIFTAFGEEIAKVGFDRVTIGRHDQGLGGAKNFIKGEYSKAIGHNIIMEGIMYNYSSTQQYEVYVSAQLNEVRNQLHTIIGNEYNINSITSVAQGQTLVNFLRDKSLDQSLINILISPYLTKNWNIEKIESILLSIKSTSPEQLELILSDDIQKFYKHGMTIEYALKMPYEALSLLLSLPSDRIEQAPLFLKYGINLDELIEKIIPINSKDKLHREVVKLTAKQLCNDMGDLGYIDTMSPNKIDFLVNNEYSSIDILYKKHYTIRNLNELDNEKFDELATNYYLVKGICNNQGIPINNFVDKYDSALALKQIIFKYTIQMFNEFNQTGLQYDDNTINKLSSAKLDLLLKEEVLVLPNYKDRLEVAQTRHIEDLQEIISLCLAQNSEAQDDPTFDIPNANIHSMDYTSTILGQNLATD